MPVQYVHPDLCCNCGKRKGTHMRSLSSEIKDNTNVMVQQTATTIEVSTETPTTRFEYQVPVCEQCNAELDKSGNTSGNYVVMFTLIGAIIGGIIGAVLGAAVIIVAIVAGILGIIIGGTIGLLIGVVVGNSMINKKYNTTANKTYFDGEHFYFWNEAFQREFAELNPEMVASFDNSDSDK